MSTYTTNFLASAWPELLAQFGQAVTYHPKGGDDVTLTAIVRAERSDEDEDLEGRRRRRVRTVTIGRNPDASEGGVAEPHEADRVAIAGETWEIEAIEAQTPAFARLRVVIQAAVERTRRGYRSGA